MALANIPKISIFFWTASLIKTNVFFTGTKFKIRFILQHDLNSKIFIWTNDIPGIVYKDPNPFSRLLKSEVVCLPKEQVACSNITNQNCHSKYLTLGSWPWMTSGRHFHNLFSFTHLKGKDSKNPVTESVLLGIDLSGYGGGGIPVILP